MASYDTVTLLKVLYPPRTFLPGSREYQSLHESNHSALDRGTMPACIFCPHTAKDVSAFLVHINTFVTDAKAKFAIRGGGQQPIPGCAPVQNGITLDLSKLKGVTAKKDGTVRIGAGEQWGNVYEVLAAQGLAVAGGRSAKGGIGASALYEDLSFFSSRTGFICDNITNYEVALGTGELINVNASTAPDLFRALRGGGNNFGVVTRFDMRTFPQSSPIWGARMFYDVSLFPSQVEALVHEIQKPNASRLTSLKLSIGYTSKLGKMVCQNQVYYTQDAAELSAVLEPFTKDILPQCEGRSYMRLIYLDCHLSLSVLPMQWDKLSSKLPVYMN